MVLRSMGSSPPRVLTVQGSLTSDSKVEAEKEAVMPSSLSSTVLILCPCCCQVESVGCFAVAVSCCQV